MSLRGYVNYPVVLSHHFLEETQDDPDFKKILEEAKGKHMAFKEEFFNQ